MKQEIRWDNRLEDRNPLHLPLPVHDTDHAQLALAQGPETLQGWGLR